MFELRVRKIVIVVEDIFHDGGPPATIPLPRVGGLIADDIIGKDGLK